jgi:hypothetical protein
MLLKSPFIPVFQSGTIDPNSEKNFVAAFHFVPLVKGEVEEDFIKISILLNEIATSSLRASSQ